jgi:hypothetical protein
MFTGVNHVYWSKSKVLQTVSANQMSGLSFSSVNANGFPETYFPFSVFVTNFESFSSEITRLPISLLPNLPTE